MLFAIISVSNASLRLRRSKQGSVVPINPIPSFPSSGLGTAVCEVRLRFGQAVRCRACLVMTTSRAWGRVSTPFQIALLGDIVYFKTRKNRMRWGLADCGSVRPLSISSVERFPRQKCQCLQWRKDAGQRSILVGRRKMGNHPTEAQSEDSFQFSILDYQSLIEGNAHFCAQFTGSRIKTERGVGNNDGILARNAVLS